MCDCVTVLLPEQGIENGAIADEVWVQGWTAFASALSEQHKN
jgi:hypothetical protein